jgi:hypothetical protein
VLDYDPATGKFTWRLTIGARAQQGELAGSLDKARGYYLIYIDRVRYKASRLAFLWMTGKWPTKFVDHINRDCGNNCWCNLREAEAWQNQGNATLRKQKRVPLKGVSWNNSHERYVAQIRINQRQIHLGWFDDPKAAHAAYVAAAKKHFGEFAREI